MPLTTTGEKVLENMQQEYGSEKGERVFYATVNKGKAGSARWHRRKPRKTGAARLTYRSKV